eukprot:MONOS_8433.1-p1 / transcript=MONOS_8433.1 / gene=MONOS_8433 / organism=Monocercomonoides_exilis_PA203 / gene_product=unspecified product / transcript_product=unspecified product / location=Mono_scaffold00317:50481-52685(+) / protein_length=735 / sequence_SO=supercontig / SO=protein_coding / is_pseudo=false
MEMEEDDDGKLVVKTSLEKTAAMGKGITSETVLPEAYKLNDEITLLDTRGFLGEELDVDKDVLSSLILQFYHKYAKKVMIVYITEFENYSNLTKAHADMEILNKKCRNKEIPILFLANKCQEKRIIKMKDRLQAKEESGSYDGRADAEGIIKEAQGKLIENIEKLKNATIIKIVKRFSEVSTSMTLEQIIETLLRKEKGATGKEAEEVRIGLKEMQIIYLWDKAIDEGRLLYYDPTLACSIERIIEKIEDLNNYRDPCDVNLEFNSDYYNSFIDSITTMANKYYWLVSAMRGRRRIPNFLKDVANTCEMLASETSKLYNSINRDVQKIDEAMDGMTYKPIESLKIEIERCRAAAQVYEDEMCKYQEMISELDRDDPVRFDTIEFFKNEGYSSNTVVIKQQIDVPNATAKFIPGNEYTYNDEKHKLCIKDGVIQGTFHAPRTWRYIGNIAYALAGLGVPMRFANKTSECKGIIELSAPMRDIPSNAQKIKEYRIIMKKFERDKSEKTRTVISRYEELISRMSGNVEIDSEKRKKKKERNEKENICGKLKIMKEYWSLQKAKLSDCLEFCEECDKMWGKYAEIIVKLYRFAQMFIPKEYINEVKREKAEETNFDNEASSSTTPSSSATPSTHSAFESRRAMAESSKSLSESKMYQKEQDLPDLLQPNDEYKIIARFAIAMEAMEDIPKLRKKINLKLNEKYNPDHVSEAVEEILVIWLQVFECKGYLEEFIECSLK